MSKRKESPLDHLMGNSPRTAPPTPLPQETPTETKTVKTEAQQETSPEVSPPPATRKPEGKGQSRRGGQPREGLQRVRYDIPPEIKAAVDDRALITGVAASQMVAFLLAHALPLLDKGEIDPTPYFTKTRSPKFRHYLEVPYPLPNDDQ